MGHIKTSAELRSLYGTPPERSARKVLPTLDTYCKNFIALSPFVLLGSTDGAGNADVSPRGERPGFTVILDDMTILLPDRPGNNRLDTLENLIVSPAIGLLFLVPRFEEMLRVNGNAEIRDDADFLMRFEVGGRRPATVLLVRIKEAYLHCAKSVMRSRLWSAESHADRTLLPSMGKMLKEHARLNGPAETEDETRRRNQKELF